MTLCRCGYGGNGLHPCHGKGYTCRKPAKLRFYNARPANVAGMQMKLQAEQTYACDACWEEFTRSPLGKRPITASCVRGRHEYVIVPMEQIPTELYAAVCPVCWGGRYRLRIGAAEYALHSEGYIVGDEHPQRVLPAWRWS